MISLGSGNPTALKVGQEGLIFGHHAAVTGRSVLKSLDGYKWNEYHLKLAGGKDTTLVYESGVWKRFALFDPDTAMSASDAAAAEIGDQVTFQGRTANVNYVGQSRLLGTRPVVYNVANFAKPAPGQPALLSLDDVTTMFHEFGHALHGMLSDVTYPSLSGTSVFTDFVELPSQLYEHWQEQPQVLRQFAKHYQTGEPLPDDLLKRFLAARKFNQGFATVEFVSSALIDLEFHTQPASAVSDVRAFERAEMEKIGMPAEIAFAAGAR